MTVGCSPRSIRRRIVAVVVPDYASMVSTATTTIQLTSAVCAVVYNCTSPNGKRRHRCDANGLNATVQSCFNICYPRFTLHDLEHSLVPFILSKTNCLTKLAGTSRRCQELCFRDYLIVNSNDGGVTNAHLLLHDVYPIASRRLLSSPLSSSRIMLIVERILANIRGFLGPHRHM